MAEQTAAEMARAQSPTAPADSATPSRRALQIALRAAWLAIGLGLTVQALIVIANYGDTILNLRSPILPHQRSLAHRRSSHQSCGGAASLGLGASRNGANLAA